MSTDTFQSTYNRENVMENQARYSSTLQRARSVDLNERFAAFPARNKAEHGSDFKPYDGHRSYASKVDVNHRNISYKQLAQDQEGFAERRAYLSNLPDEKLGSLRGHEKNVESLRAAKSDRNLASSTSLSSAEHTAETDRNSKTSKVLEVMNKGKMTGKVEYNPRPTTADPFYDQTRGNVLLQRSQSSLLPNRPKSTIESRSKSPSPGMPTVDPNCNLGLFSDPNRYETGKEYGEEQSELREGIAQLHLDSNSSSVQSNSASIKHSEEKEHRGTQEIGNLNNGYRHGQQQQYMHGYGLSPVFRPVAAQFVPTSPGLYPQTVVPPSPAPYPVQSSAGLSPYHGGMASPYVSASPNFDYFRMMSQHQFLSQDDGGNHPQQFYLPANEGVQASPYHMPSPYLGYLPPGTPQQAMSASYPATPGHRPIMGTTESNQQYIQDPLYATAAAVVHQGVDFSPAPFAAPAIYQSPLQRPQMGTSQLLPVMNMPPAANQPVSTKEPRYLRASIQNQNTSNTQRSNNIERSSNQQTYGLKPETTLQRAHRMTNTVSNHSAQMFEQKKSTILQMPNQNNAFANQKDDLQMNASINGGSIQKAAMLEELRNKMKQMPQSSSHSRRNSNSGFQSSASIAVSWGLIDIKNMVYDFAKDQYGSRFIQQKLEDPTVAFAEKEALFEEVLPHARTLCKDVFGNYVVQKLLDPRVGTAEQQAQLCDKAIVGNVVDLSTHMYGCRVIQKLIEQIFGQRNPQSNSKIYSTAYQDSILQELKDAVMDCVRDQNGNHVIQKCIEQIRPITRIDFMLEVFENKFNMMARHPYGCRVVQRVLENCGRVRIERALNELVNQCTSLTTDQYANYVVQHIVTHQPQGMYRKQLFEVVTKNVLQFSQHKFGSNVVETCLQSGTPEERARLIDGMLFGSTPALEVMMKDPYANYVVQKVIDRSTPEQYGKVCQIVRENENSLKRLTYGKHIISKIKT